MKLYFLLFSIQSLGCGFVVYVLTYKARVGSFDMLKAVSCLPMSMLFNDSVYSTIKTTRKKMDLTETLKDLYNPTI